MGTIRNIVKVIVFVILFLFLLFVMSHVLSRSHGTYWAEGTGMDLIHQYKNQYDICFAGSSIVIASISNQELYEKYGISSVSVGGPVQPLFMTKYIIEEVLQYQSPKAIVLDTRSLFYGEESIKEGMDLFEEEYVHYSLDFLRSNKIKKAALDQINKQYKSIDYKAYFSRLYDRHSQWKNLSEVDFLGYNNSMYMNGNIMLTEIHNVTSVVETEHAISKENERELLAIKKECEKKRTDLILMTGYMESDLMKRDKLKELAEKYSVKYLDFNDVVEEIGFTEEMISDYIHFNVIGAVVWSDYIGQYLNTQYSFDKCSERLDQLYQGQGKLFSEYKRFVTNKMVFTRSSNFKAFLQEICRADFNAISIFVAVCDEAYRNLDDEGKELLQQLGLDGPQCVRGSFAGICVSDGVYQKKAKKKKVILSGDVGALQYKIESAGMNSAEGPCASIVINDEEYAKGRRGFNIVVFDNKLEKLIISKCFDTYSASDPKGS